MRLSSPRVHPLASSEWTDEVRQVLASTINASRDGALNIFSTLAHHPKLLKRWLVFGTHILRKSSLSPRQRELAILRVGWLCGSEYEWGQHVTIARRSSITDEEIRRVADGPDAPGWGDEEREILRATDELHHDFMIDELTWQQLSRRLDEQQLMDLIFTVGQYHLVSMALNTLGVQLDEGYPSFEQSAGRRPAIADRRRGASGPSSSAVDPAAPTRPDPTIGGRQDGGAA